jgi:tetratricopeptide (TPR) repeat protein
MKREQTTFLLGGLTFGFIAGFLVAYVWMAPTSVSLQSAAPPPPAMSEAAAPAPSGGESSGADPHLDVMARVTELKQHLEHSPDDVDALIELGSYYLRAAKAEQAVGYLRKAQQLQPENFHGSLFLGMALASSGDTNGALDLMDKTARGNPTRGEPHLLRASILLNNLGDTDGASKELARARALSPELPGLADLEREIGEARSRAGQAPAGNPG